MVIKLRVIGPRGDVEFISPWDNLEKITVLQLKEKIAQTFMTGDNILLIFGTELLKDPDLLSSYGIQHMSTIHMVIRLPNTSDVMKTHRDSELKLPQ